MWLKRKRKAVRWRRSDDLIAFLESLPRIRVSDEYKEIDRARDFAAVFNENSTAEQGRKVMSQIVDICDPRITSEDADKPGTLAYKVGMRRVLQEIQRCFVVREERDALVENDQPEATRPWDDWSDEEADV